MIFPLLLWKVFVEVECVGLEWEEMYNGKDRQRQIWTTTRTLSGEDTREKVQIVELVWLI